jgi:hypothetical protein
LDVAIQISIFIDMLYLYINKLQTWQMSSMLPGKADIEKVGLNAQWGRVGKQLSLDSYGLISWVRRNRA